jgi:hypothetical protein
VADAVVFGAAIAAAGMWSAPGLAGWPRPARLLASGGGPADWRVAAK